MKKGSLDFVTWYKKQKRISWTTLLIRKHRRCRRKLLPDSQQLSLTACPGPAWTILKLTMMVCLQELSIW
ncbi:hypothetical protein DPMN_170357 [Dreissena polymorpha]|uniref:Uncharacterized protein n=1 Tax=Dreissena polymorpha TaxID=45954 RepID=A0A9D4DZA8_DREPO|nr:hypothetical protein DPMN_170357 [Dreissena polymorpha]